MTVEHVISLPSEFGADEERSLSSVDTIIIHSMYNPQSDTPFAADSCKNILDEYEVSAHYLIDREGIIWQLVPENRMAWHAGKSRMPNSDHREKVNVFSVGIELIGNETDGFTDSQYERLVLLIVNIMTRCPIKNIFGHQDITQHIRENPKTDPWNFNWNLFRSRMNETTDTSDLSIGI